jgi:hypothetical protein
LAARRPNVGILSRGQRAGYAAETARSCARLSLQAKSGALAALRAGAEKKERTIALEMTMGNDGQCCGAERRAGFHIDIREITASSFSPASVAHLSRHGIV